MDELVVADAGPLIALGLVDALEALARLHGGVFVPHAVRIECTARPDKPAAVAIERAFALGHLAPQPDRIVLAGRQIGTLDAGESAAIELAEALGARLLVDERRGRAVARARGLTVVGTVAVLIAARRRGFVPALSPLFDRLAAGSYFLSNALIKAALAQVGEDESSGRPT